MFSCVCACCQCCAVVRLNAIVQSESEATADGGPRKIIIWKDRNRSVQLLNVYASFLFNVLHLYGVCN